MLRFVKFIILFFFLTFQLVRSQVIENKLSKDELNKLENSSVKELIEKSKYYSTTNNIPGNIIVQQKLQQHYKEKGENKKLAESYLIEGKLLNQISDFKSAIEKLVIAKQYFNELNQSLKVAETSLEIGNIYGQLNDFKNALLNINEAEKEFLKNKKDESLKSTYYSKAIIYGSNNELDSADFYLNKSLNLHKDTLTISYCGLLNNIGAIYSKRNKNEIALNYYYRALDLFKNLKSEIGIAVTNTNIAYIYYKNKEFQKASKIYIESEAIFKSQNDLLNLEHTYDMLSAIYEDQNNYHLAFKYINKRDSIEQIINKSDITLRANELMMKYEIVNANNAIQLLKEKNRSAKFQKQILIIGIVLLVSFTIFLIIYLRIKLKNNKLKREILEKEANQLNLKISIKNKELEIFALKFIEKNNLLNELKTKLKKLSQKDNSSSDKLKELSLAINSNLSTEQDRLEFDAQLLNLQHDFFIKLNQLEVNLTEYEKRLCSLIVIDLKSKDISSLLNISIEGVKKSRYRLRQKLNISSKENLSDFLKSL